LGLIKLGIRNVRNLAEVDIEPSLNLNIIHGKNASGKTSILESIYYLGRARSFRSNRLDRVMRKGAEEITIFGSLHNPHGSPIPLGLERSSKKLTIKINGEKVSTISELVSVLPIQIIHPNSHRLMEEGPKYRRQFLDWGVFHVEHDVFHVWKRFQRAMKQRNAALRGNDKGLSKGIWDSEVIECTRLIDNHRKQYVGKLVHILPRYLGAIVGDLPLEVNYNPGWQVNEEYADVLKKALSRDRELGYTSRGPHRADLEFKIDGIPALDFVSRGQQKILVSALMLAQAGLFTEVTGKRCVLLIDDIAAELDQEHRERLLGVISELNVQTFITVIDPSSLPLEDLEDKKMFHVERANVQEVV
jgi:DNA replication and repair protein RecF